MMTFNNIYRGIVIDNNDPLKSGRVRVRIYPMFVGVRDDTLPWAIYADGMMGGLTNNGSVFVPENKSHVFVFFENGDHQFPVYFAAAPAIQSGEPDVPKLSREDDGSVAAINGRRKTGIAQSVSGTWDEPNSAYDPTYPANKVIRTKSGIVIELDDTTSKERIHISHPSGTRTEISASGDIVEHVQGNSFKVVIGNDKIHVTGSVEINVTGDVGLVAANVNVKGNVKITGNAEVTGNVTTTSGNVTTVSGDVETTTGDVKAGAITLKNHRHTISSGSSAGVTALPVLPAP